MATDYTKCSIGFASGNAFNNLTTALSFFGDLLDNMMPEKMIITHINLYCRKRGTLKTEIRYVLDNVISVDERVLFPTKEELLKSL